MGMFWRCGHNDRAEAYFKTMDHFDDRVAVAMLDCYAKHGDVHSVLSLFRRLCAEYESYRSDPAVLCTVISACTDSGLRDEAMLIFEEAQRDNINQSRLLDDALYTNTFSRSVQSTIQKMVRR